MKSHEEQRGLVFFLAGFFIGVLYIYFTGSYRDTETDFLSVQNLMQISYMDFAHEDYLWFLFKKRLGVLFLLVLASFALPGKYLLLGFLMVFGCSMGSMLSVLVVRYGIRGILLFLGFVLPQDVIYVPAVFQWVNVLTAWNEGLFYRGNALTGNRRGKWHTMVKTALLAGVTIIGILLECYVNPFVVKWCLKIF
ncbi:MAG: stage II sporulation protein M [Lachnospiraceae bacterium]|nr:stage II sporulation protein M [Lachnospiraceae bacterium]